jgi:hypothetical protein
MYLILISLQLYCERSEATLAALTPPLALLAALSCFTLRLKPRKTGNLGNNPVRGQLQKTAFDS